MNFSNLNKQLNKGSLYYLLKDIYGDKEFYKRYSDLLNTFYNNFDDSENISLFSSPGRIEIGGNHTDHQNGKVLAAAVDLDIACVATPNSDNSVKIISKHNVIKMNLDTLDFKLSETGKSEALIRGIAKKFRDVGYNIGGFNAVTDSLIPMGSGLSSSAAFEVLIGNIFNKFYAKEKVTAKDIAIFGQFAENEYFKKPCGLMDQLSSSLGGITMTDFYANNALSEYIYFDFDNIGYDIIVIKSEASHENLTNEYEEITKEMHSIAGFFNKQYLSEVDEEIFYSFVKELRNRFGDRAVLRAIHFFNENKRVKREFYYLKNRKIDEFLNEVIESGRSSFMYLQNIYPFKNYKNQPLSVELALCEKLIHNGAFRVHGGGFGGTILTFVKKEESTTFIEKYTRITNQNSCIKLKIRKFGGKMII